MRTGFGEPRMTGDEQQLTDLIFYARHPERRGRRLMQGEANFARLSREWQQIRDLQVRPSLNDNAHKRFFCRCSSETVLGGGGDPSIGSLSRGHPAEFSAGLDLR